MIYKLYTKEAIPPALMRSWHDFVNTLTPAWFYNKTPEEAGDLAIKLFKEQVGDLWLEASHPCPHGFEDWGDCPDCRH